MFLGDKKVSIKDFFFKEVKRSPYEKEVYKKNKERLSDFEKQYKDFKIDILHPINGLKDKKELKEKINNLKKEIEEYEKKNRSLKKGLLVGLVCSFFVLIFVIGAISEKDKDISNKDDTYQTEKPVVIEEPSKTAPSINEELVSETKYDKENHETSTEEVSKITTSLEEELVNNIPSYIDGTYAEVNNNEPFFSDSDKKRTDSFEIYSDLDNKGRCGTAYANICTDLMPTGEREDIGMIKPSGWHTIKYAGVVEGNYLYNRCHLIGYQLAGEQANELNLITGTRYFNTEGMLPFENKVASYVENTGNHVLYRVTPVFEDDNLVAKGVLMEAYSVEDQGEGIKFNAFVYNVQPGVEIDYATGDSKLKDGVEVVEATPSPTPCPTPEPTIEPTAPPSVECDWVLNTNTGVFHYPDCKSVKQMKEKNKEYFTGTKEEAMSMGYTPCHNCFDY